MIRHTIVSLNWTAILGIVVALGIFSVFSYYTLSLGAGISGLILCYLLWFRTHPNVWWYDVLFFVVVTTVAIGSTTIVIMTCQVAELVDLTTAVCANMSVDRIAMTTWSMLMLTSIIIWGIAKTYIWIQVRNQRFP